LAIARQFGVTVLQRNDEDTANFETTHWRYTASLDAAMSLVPEDLAVIQMARLWLKDKAQLYDGFTCVGEGTAATPALALCAAALRSHAHRMGEGE
jgi:hypothetical protein